MGLESLEEFRIANHVAQPSANPGRVVEHHTGGHAADALPDGLETMRDALGGFPRKVLQQCGIAKGETNHSVLDLSRVRISRLPIGLGGAKVHLRRAR
ncbi:MAG: hypothetical protein C7B45_16720 [Sulfobacillus acidophilus]|uniref:Uncharacterized protein n=1 Tax=Sulfobacillus acidophilus TaxID=53633 RepID=A0A2T2WCW5_9FIRM|nr:MAG: hypothetical protein C7B45_16720 [Sulfobacillus acidophilus]